MEQQNVSDYPSRFTAWVGSCPSRCWYVTPGQPSATSSFMVMGYP
jgi:hypothetical protein